MTHKFVESEWTRRPTGEFAGHVRSDAEVGLRSPTLAAQLAARRAHLREHGFIRAQTVERGNPYSNVPAGSWWAATRGLAEHAPEGYTVMPRSVDGQDVYRKVYDGAETSLRMPSAQAIRRFAASAGTTFDVPVEASTPHGPVTGHVRVTANGGGRWSVSAVEMPRPQGDYVAESVEAVLESRRPTRALPQVRDILARRRARIASAGVRVRQVESSWITGLGYNAEGNQMVVEMEGRAYGYRVPPETFRAALAAPSLGQAYNRLVKGEPRFEVVQHDACGRYYNVEAGHRCASEHDAPRVLANA